METELNILPVGSQSGQPLLLCPVCGGDYVHPVMVACNPAGSSGSKVIVRARGVYLNPLAPETDRGVLITLQFWCEEGHSFSYALEFHKGQTFLERRSQVPAPCEPVIWRS